MHRLHLVLAIGSAALPLAVSAQSVADAARELGRAEGRHEACQKTPGANCSSLLLALVEAAKALGAAEARQAAAMPAPTPTEAPSPPPAPLESGISALIDEAQKVQGTVDKLRAERPSLFDTMDRARDSALGVNTGHPHGKAAVEKARGMPDVVEEINKDIRIAQKEADKAVNLTLDLRHCTNASGCGDRETQYQTAKAAVEAVKATARKTNEAIKQLRRDEREITATEAGLDAAQRAAYVRFDEGLASLPSARSLLGDDSYGLYASKEEALVALQYGMDIRKGLLGRNRLSMHLTAPLGAGSKRASLFNNVSGVNDEGSFGIGYGMARANPVGDGLYRAMLGATMSRKKHGYLFSNGAQVSEVEQSRRHWRVGVEVDLTMFSEGRAKTAHRFTLQHERKYKDADAGILCPGGSSSAPVGCFSGPLSAPQLIEGSSLSYAYHFSLGTASFAPKLSYESATKISSLDIPIYLIGTKDRKALNAGIQLGWARKPGQGSAPAQSDFNFGLFVGAPFDLLSGRGIDSR